MRLSHTRHRTIRCRATATPDYLWLFWGLTGLLVILSLSACASTGPKPNLIIKNQGAVIQLPKNPPRLVAIEAPGAPKKPDTVYVSDPTRVEPNATWKAPADGAWVWKNRDLNSIIYALEEYPKYIGVLHGLISDHNKRMGAIEKDKQGWGGKLWGWWK